MIESSMKVTFEKKSVWNTCYNIYFVSCFAGTHGSSIELKVCDYNDSYPLITNLSVVN